MSKILDKAQQEKIKEIEVREYKLLKQLSELAEKKDTDENAAKEYDALLNQEIQNIKDELKKIIQESGGKAWDFSKEKKQPVFAEDDVLELKPLTSDYYDLYAKTRAEYASTPNYYSDPEKRNFILSEFNQEKSFFLAVIRKSDSAYMGYVGLKDTTSNLWEFAIELLPEYCRQGNGYRAIKCFLKKVSEITGNDNEQFMALVEVDNIPSQKLMLKLGGRLIDIYDYVFHDEERAEQFEEEHLDEITDHMKELADELMVEPRKLLSHVLDYRIFAEKL